MILQFWLATTILLIIVSVFAAIPFLKIKKEGKQEYNTRNQLNRSLYQIRLLELERDAEQGMLSDKNKMLTELQYNLLDDIDDNQEIKKPARSKLIFLPGLFLLIVGSLALYSRVGAYEEVQHWQNTLQRYPALQRQLFKDSDSEATEQNLRDIMLGLRTNLQDNSEDPQGWLLYARLGMILENTDLALDAISKAYSLDPKSVDIRLLYIQLSMQTGDDFLQQKAQLMLTQLLKEIPNNVDAWSMSAFMALGDKDYSRAIFSWKRLLQIVSPNTKQARILKDSINYAQKKLSILKTNRLSVPNKVNKSTL